MKRRFLILSLSLIIFFFFGRGTLCAEVKIGTAEGLIELSKNVSSGSLYKGTTVLLDADIDFSGSFSEQFGPIGYYNLYNDYKYLQGTFDGQGYTINGLAMNSSSEYVGLFGYSKGSTIRNVVLDSSCSVVSSYRGSNNVYIGGIIGEFYASRGPCLIENTVNMASVSFTGSTSSNLYLGGIVGEPSGTVKNCANYGSVTYSGKSICYAYIGGIAGYFTGNSSNIFIYIQNCLNHGTVTQWNYKKCPGHWRDFRIC